MCVKAYTVTGQYESQLFFCVGLGFRAQGADLVCERPFSSSPFSYSYCFCLFLLLLLMLVLLLLLLLQLLLSGELARIASSREELGGTPP